MKRRLFLTGPMGCGKSTAIQAALGENLPKCGGFLTRRARDAEGNAVSFYLASPDGIKQATFLDCTGPKARMDLDVFGTLGVELLMKGIATPACEPARNDRYVLDEIGGMELLCPEFMAALDKLFSSDAPILGVLKGEGPASAMIARLGLTEEYDQAAARLRRRLQNDPDTLVYECGKFDENALRLARQWAEENFHEELF